jgi:predicted RNase H-like HicB family nuclease
MGGATTRRFKVVVERMDDGYVAYPLGIRGVVVGDGQTFEEALASVTKAIEFHIETFGADALEGASNPESLYLVETEVTVDG